jgi:hypothetical protein
LAFNALDGANLQVFDGVWNRYLTGLGRMLEMMVVARRANAKPAIRLKLPDDFPAAMAQSQPLRCV